MIEDFNYQDRACASYASPRRRILDAFVAQRMQLNLSALLEEAFKEGLYSPKTSKCDAGGIRAALCRVLLRNHLSALEPWRDPAITALSQS